MVPLERSVKVTASGAGPLVGAALKAAVGTPETDAPGRACESVKTSTSDPRSKAMRPLPGSGGFKNRIPTSDFMRFRVARPPRTTRRCLVMMTIQHSPAKRLWPGSGRRHPSAELAPGPQAMSNSCPHPFPTVGARGSHSLSPSFRTHLTAQDDQLPPAPTGAPPPAWHSDPLECLSTVKAPPTRNKQKTSVSRKGPAPGPRAPQDPSPSAPPASRFPRIIRKGRKAGHLLGGAPGEGLPERIVIHDGALEGFEASLRAP